MNEQIFRKSALERLSSPEELDSLMQVTSPKAWLALVALGGLILMAVIWGICGTISTKVTGRGILMHPGGILAILSKASGEVSAVYARPGDPVGKGQVLVTIAQNKLIENIKNAAADLAEMKREYAGKPRAQAQGEDEIIAGQQRKITQQERLIASLEYDLDANSKVLSPMNGRVLEITAQEGELIEKGARLLTLERTEDAAKDIEAIIYIDPNEGKKVVPGMKIFISPSSVKRGESGSIFGKVTEVSEFPASPQGMMRSLQNEKLVQSLSSEGAPFEIHADLISDSTTASGYRWSSGKGPPMKLQSGTLCTGSIIIEEQRPVNLVIPWLKKSLFGEQSGGS
jgi:biotin carboxyl carrier protein